MSVPAGSILPVLHSPLLRASARLRHGFFTRLGGVSTQPYDSLNCSFGSGDERKPIEENRRRVVAAVDGGNARLFTLAQVHGREAVNVDHDPPAASREGDALVSSTPGMLVGVTTADCVPVLLADPVAGVVAAVHAGWRGALAGVIDSALEAMEDAGATRANVRAAIGPAIRQASYEVGADVFEAVSDGASFDTAYLFESHRERYRFDLPGFVRALCLQAGVPLLDDIGLDTYDDPTRFFSYRRTCHADGADYGRQVSVIGLAA